LIFSAFIFLFISSNAIYSQKINYEDFFHDKTLRVDIFRSGNYIKEKFEIISFFEHPLWSGSKNYLVSNDSIGEILILTSL